MVTGHILETHPVATNDRGRMDLVPDQIVGPLQKKQLLIKSETVV